MEYKKKEKKGRIVKGNVKGKKEKMKKKFGVEGYVNVDKY